jgi:hypothetical protein
MPVPEEICLYAGVKGFQNISKSSLSVARIMIDEVWKALLLFSKQKFGKITKSIIGETIIVIKPGSGIPDDLPETIKVVELEYTEVNLAADMVDSLGGGGKTIFIAGDCLDIKSVDIINFLNDSDIYSTDLNVPFIPEHLFKNKYKKIKKYFFKIVEGKFAVGRFFIIKNYLLKSCILKAAEFVDIAEDPIKTARKMGAKLSLKYTLGRLCIADIETFADKKFNLNTKLVISDSASLGLGITSIERLNSI